MRASIQELTAAAVAPTAPAAAELPPTPNIGAAPADIVAAAGAAAGASQNSEQAAKDL